jgi:hypothetical protein
VASKIGAIVHDRLALSFEGSAGLAALCPISIKNEASGLM